MHFTDGDGLVHGVAYAFGKKGNRSEPNKYACFFDHQVLFIDNCHLLKSTSIWKKVKIDSSHILNDKNLAFIASLIVYYSYFNIEIIVLSMCVSLPLPTIGF